MCVCESSARVDTRIKNRSNRLTADQTRLTTALCDACATRQGVTDKVDLHRGKGQGM